MGVKNKVLIDGELLTTSLVTLYEDLDNVQTRIVAFSVVNNDPSLSRTYDLHIVPDGGSASSSNIVVKGAALFPSESEAVMEPINQIIPAGGSLVMKASANSSIAVRASGIQFT